LQGLLKAKHNFWPRKWFDWPGVVLLRGELKYELFGWLKYFLFIVTLTKHMPTPLKPHVLEYELAWYDSNSTKYLVSDFRKGFKLGLTTGTVQHSTAKNHKSASENKQEVYKKLAIESPSLKPLRKPDTKYFVELLSYPASSYSSTWGFSGVGICFGCHYE
jgi:hypothetical protein